MLSRLVMFLDWYGGKGPSYNSGAIGMWVIFGIAGIIMFFVTLSKIGKYKKKPKDQKKLFDDVILFVIITIVFFGISLYNYYHIVPDNPSMNRDEIYERSN